MAVTISGKLIGPNGDPRSGVTIQLRAVKTSSAVVQLAPSTSVTGSDGSYSLSVEVGTHEVMIEAFGQPYEKVGTIAVYADSTAGTLNDFLTAPGETELTPAIVATVEEMRTASLAARDETLAARDITVTAAQSAITSGNLQPDEATGLANTTNGQIFTVGYGSGADISYKTFENVNGVAVVRIEALGKGAVDAVQSDMDILGQSVIKGDDIFLPNGRKIINGMAGSDGFGNVYSDERGKFYGGGVSHDTSEIIFDPYIAMVIGDQTDGVTPWTVFYKNGHIKTNICELIEHPSPVYHLNPPGIYLADNATPNPNAFMRPIMLKDLNDFNIGLYGMSLDYAVRGDAASGRQAAEWLYEWAMRRSMVIRNGSGNPGASYERHWRVANFAICYFIGKNEINFELRREIIDWFTDLGNTMILDFDGYSAKTNNHAYWCAASVYALYLVTGIEEFKTFSLNQYDLAMNRIQEDGTLTTELDRLKRVLYYHSFALEPLIMMCELAIQKGEDLYNRSSKLFLLIETTIHGVYDPVWFKNIAGLSNDQEPVTGGGWGGFLSLRYPELIQGRLNADITVYTDQFFMGKTYELARLWVK
ncbi:prophage tail fiber N-terminal domain-containing protein [Sodalis sp. RH20]|uniref:prophage tail fiber N-terminal domain-containing protein n=1 Tax=unclassified Sodalis (in: enterobacteria) TaxID=2636512 RepID=UPI0039B6401F